MKLESREYKLLVNHEPFASPSAAVKAVWDEIEDAAKTLTMVRTKGSLDEKEVSSVIFLDTPDHTLRRNSLALRLRVADEALEVTLKCRSEDRYFASGTNVGAAGGLKGEAKFEEDIAPVFRCRFSHSATIKVAGNGKAALQKAPRTLREVSALFPTLGTLRAESRRCAPQTPLQVVNGIAVEELVWKGGKFVFRQASGKKSQKATVALILWTRGKAGRPAVAELSFRIKSREERFSGDLAQATRLTYKLLQRLDCSRPGGMTKTEYIYRDASLD